MEKVKEADATIAAYMNAINAASQALQSPNSQVPREVVLRCIAAHSRDVLHRFGMSLWPKLHSYMESSLRTGPINDVQRDCAEAFNKAMQQLLQDNDGRL